MLDAAIKALTQMFSPPFRRVLLKSIGLALLMIVLVGIGLNRLFSWMADSGAVWADSPAAVWEASEVCFTCVLGDDALESVTLGDHGYAKAGGGARVHVDLSTSSPEATLRLAPKLKDATGASWVDAPCASTSWNVWPT